MNTTAAHYAALFEPLEREVGALSDETLTGIIGFSGGGPVSVLSIPGKQIHVTCELSLYPEQVPSSDGERFELLSRVPLTVSQAQSLLTAVGNLSMDVELGAGYTIDVSGVSTVPGLSLVRLQRYSSLNSGGAAFAVYELVSVGHEA